MSRTRRGFTFIELLVVMIVLGLLAAIASLKYIDLKNRALTAQAAADMEAIRLAAYGTWYETGSWPSEVGPGMVPTEMVAYLPKNFVFARPEYTLDWENFAPPGGGTTASMQIGVVISSTNSRMQLALEQTLGNKGPFFITGSDLTFVIVGPDGRS
ncbi:MAG TPA: prepilin-type N-terminal cleavage/methylation domain-containing protein [Gemmatimonadales bacterium]|jgi:prepilin-type N-terminal cleavage/methylation domain-containing protein